jgi:hypothetical protein
MPDIGMEQDAITYHLCADIRAAALPLISCCCFPAAASWLVCAIASGYVHGLPAVDCQTCSKI